MRSKDIHIAIKNGKDMDDLIEKYGFSCKEDLFEAIHNIAPVGAKRFIREIIRNQKRKHR